MSGIRRVSDLGTRGAVNIVDGSIQTADIANNAITQAKLSTDVPLSGMRNALINGDFRIWQRGAGPYDGTAYRYYADRWNGARNSFASGMSVSRQSSGLAGFQYCMRVQRDLNNNTANSLFVAQSVESLNSVQFQGQSVVFSFYARAGSNYSASGNALNVQVQTGTGTDQNHVSGGFTNGTNIVNSNVTLTTAWQRFSVTALAGANINQIGVAFTFTPTGTASTNDYFEFTGAQLEVGSQPTAFEQRQYGIEFLLCQRYYQVYPYGEYNEVVGVLGYQPANYYYGTQNVRVPMRATPSTTTPTPSFRRASDATTQTGTNIYYNAQGDGIYFAIQCSNSGYNAVDLFLSSVASAEIV